MSTTAVAVGLLLSVSPSTAHAYLDPGTGAVMLQAAIAAIAGGMLIFRQYWYRLINIFRKKDPAADKQPGDQRQK